MSTPRIVVVEDELTIRLFLEETLSNEGYQVVAVSSGEEILPLLKEQVFDLALLDLVLPGISGMEVLAVLRQQAPDTVVILLTAHASLETAVEALRQGAHLAEAQQVTLPQIETLAASLEAPFCITSAKTGEMVETAFQQLGRLLLS